MRKTIGRAILYFLTPTGCVASTNEFAKSADLDNLERRLSTLEQKFVVLTKLHISSMKSAHIAPKPSAKAKARGRKNAG